MTKSSAWGICAPLRARLWRQEHGLYPASPAGLVLRSRHSGSGPRALDRSWTDDGVLGICLERFSVYGLATISSSCLTPHGNRLVCSQQHWRFAAARRHLFDGFDRAILDQQSGIEIVHRGADVARKEVKRLAHLWTRGAVLHSHGQA